MPSSALSHVSDLDSNLVTWWVTRQENDDDSGWKLEARSAEEAIRSANDQSSISLGHPYTMAVRYSDHFPDQPRSSKPA
jgi:hypothetical protein